MPATLFNRRREGWVTDGVPMVAPQLEREMDSRPRTSAGESQMPGVGGLSKSDGKGESTTFLGCGAKMIARRGLCRAR